MKSILASLTGYGNDLSTLETAFSVAQQFSAHSDCLFISPEFPSAKELAYSGMLVRHGLLSDRLREIESDAASRKAKAKSAYEQLLKTQKPAVLQEPDESLVASVSWIDMPGTDIPDTIARARYHDLTVVGRESVPDVVKVDRAGTIVLGSGRPTLIAPAASRSGFGKTIAIAWKDNPETARAVTVAAPFLTMANSTVVITVCEDPQYDADTKQSGQFLVEQLRRNGYSAVARHVEFNPHPASSSLLNEAYSCSADMLVMGAYGHNRFREIIFGGVTRDVIAECALPVLMFH